MKPFMQPDITFVADESVDYNLIKFLRSRNLSILSLQEQSPSITDNQVLKIACNYNAVLITEDKDFGELVFKLKMPHAGILLLRTEEMLIEEKSELIFHFLTTHSEKLSHNFAVIKQGKLRIRKPDKI